MNILFLSGQYPPHAKGGGEISTHLIARGLAERGYTVHVLTEGETSRQADIDGVKVRYEPLRLTKKPLFERLQSARIARRITDAIDVTSYDIVHAHDFRSALVLAEMNIPHSMVTVRDYAQISGDTNYLQADGSIPRSTGTMAAELRSKRIHEARGVRKIGRAAQYLLNIGYRRHAFQRLPFHVFISHAQRSEMLRHQSIPQEKTAVIYNPVAPEYITTPVVDTNSQRILYAGRIELYKGVSLLLEAWRQIAKDFPEAELTLVGSGAQNDEYKKRIRDISLSDRTKFIDHVPMEHMLKTYDQAGVVVAPHLWIEPFGRTVVESMARGRVVVAANVGGPGEIIKHMKTGLLFERGSVSGLREALTTALTLSVNTRQAMQGAAHQWAAKNLSILTITEQYENVYKGLMKR